MAHYQGGDVTKGLTELEARANLMIDELLWWTAALKSAREVQDNGGTRASAGARVAR